MHTEMPKQDFASQPRPHYPPPSGAPLPPAPVKDYLIPAILVTLLCFFPTGIAAIIYATKVQPALQFGNVAEARRASSRAKVLCWISLGIGLAFYLIVVVAVVAAAASTPTDYTSTY